MYISDRVPSRTLDIPRLVVGWSCFLCACSFVRRQKQQQQLQLTGPVNSHFRVPSTCYRTLHATLEAVCWWSGVVWNGIESKHAAGSIQMFQHTLSKHVPCHAGHMLQLPVTPLTELCAVKQHTVKRICAVPSESSLFS